MFLFDGPIDGVDAINEASGLDRSNPRWCWPEDKAWFFGNEIDHPWSYVAGSRDLIDEVMSDSGLLVVPADPGDGW